MRHKNLRKFSYLKKLKLNSLTATKMGKLFFLYSHIQINLISPFHRHRARNIAQKIIFFFFFVHKKRENDEKVFIPHRITE